MHSSDRTNVGTSGRCQAAAGREQTTPRLQAVGGDVNGLLWIELLSGQLEWVSQRRPAKEVQSELPVARVRRSRRRHPKTRFVLPLSAARLSQVVRSLNAAAALMKH